jgi:hypothetical protein
VSYGFDDQLAWRHLHRRYYPEIKVDAARRVFVHTLEIIRTNTVLERLHLSTE